MKNRLLILTLVVGCFVPVFAQQVTQQQISNNLLFLRKDEIDYT